VEYLTLLGQGWLLFHGWSGFIFFAGIQGNNPFILSNYCTKIVAVISQMRLWAMYRRKEVLVAMTGIVCLALIAMGLVEGFGYANVEGATIPSI